jgi:hypothetical protein
VTWIVLKEPITISSEQVRFLRGALLRDVGHFEVDFGVRQTWDLIFLPLLLATAIGDYNSA